MVRTSRTSGGRTTSKTTNLNTLKRLNKELEKGLKTRKKLIKEMRKAIKLEKEIKILKSKRVTTTRIIPRRRRRKPQSLSRHFI